MSKVSVIIPVYNVEKYIEKCLDSVLNQTYKNIEIVCINDCSTDNSLKILKNFSIKDKRIKIISKDKNRGISAARNTGLKHSSGKYVYFIDSDDWIDSNYIEKMVEAIEKSGTDIVLNTNIVKDFNHKQEFFKWGKYPEKLPEGEFLNKTDAINKTPCMIWCHLYRKEFLDKFNLKFQEGYIFEDEYFQHISKINTDKIFAFFGPRYYYTQREGSIMGTGKNRVKEYVKTFTLIFNFYKNNNLLEKYGDAEIFYTNIINDIKTEEDFKTAKEYFNLIYEEFSKNSVFKSDYDKFIINGLLSSATFKKYTESFGKRPYLTYITRYRIKRGNNIKVSVIIPVYNVENYLEKCLKSVCGQSLEDIEIICINDCSTDDSFEVLKKFAREDNRIKIINFKENKGAAIARNEGINAAHGEYIGFVDADDYIDLDFYEKLYKNASLNSSDVAIGNIATGRNGKEVFNYLIWFQKIKENKFSFSGNFPIGLYKKEFIKFHNIYFTPGMVYGEDRMFPVQSAYYSKKFTQIEDTYYHYRERENSASKILHKKQLKDFTVTTNLVLDFINENITSNNDKTAVLEGFITQALYLFQTADKNSLVYLKSLYQDFLNKIHPEIQKHFFLNILNPKKDNEEIQKQITIILQKNIIKTLRTKHLAGISQ